MDASKICISGPLASYVDGLWSALANQGYTSLSIANVARLMAHLSRWLEREGLGGAQLKSDQIDRFLRHRRRAGYTAFLSRRGLKSILQYLRSIGVVPSRASPEVVPTAVDVLVTGYMGWVARERPVVPANAAFYERIAREFLPSDGNPLSLKPASVTAFVLKQSRTYGVSYTKRKVSALRSLLRYLFVHRAIETDLAVAVPAVAGWRLTSLPRDIPAAHVAQLLRSCDRRTPEGRRAFAALLLMVRLGLRRGEVVALNLDDIDWRQGQLLIHGKGRQLDRLPLPADVGSALAGYIRRSRPRVQSRTVFLRMRAPHGPLTSSGMQAIVHAACLRAGLPVIGAHRLRHSAATEMLRHGASLSEIAQVLRHRHLDTTAIYAKVDRAALRQLVQPWPGGDL